MFSLFNVLSNIEEKILDERFREINLTNTTILQNYYSTSRVPRAMQLKILQNKS